VGTKLAKLFGSLTGKRAFLSEHFFMKKFSDGKILVIFLIQNSEMFILLCGFMGIRAPGSTKIWTKLAKLHQKKLWEIWSRFPFTRQITLKD
jgi:hypothetical protein